MRQTHHRGNQGEPRARENPQREPCLLKELVVPQTLNTTVPLATIKTTLAGSHRQNWIIIQTRHTIGLFSAPLSWRSWHKKKCYKRSQHKYHMLHYLSGWFLHLVFPTYGTQRTETCQHPLQSEICRHSFQSTHWQVINPTKICMLWYTGRARTVDAYVRSLQ